ncbi:MAG: signal peptidase II [Holosporaceae bacterium]|jgi:signal peptidase II|nr:signal peptidase II [Holosporaceae bacterium]
MSKGFGCLRLMIVATFILFCDQLSKLAVIHFLLRGGCCRVFPFFNIVRVENRGITFGIFNSEATNEWVLILISLAIVILLIMWVKNETDYQFPASIVAAGAIGNVLDRIIHGAVIDFFDFYIGEYHWPAFNVADGAIVVAVSAMVYISFRSRKLQKL